MSTRQGKTTMGITTGNPGNIRFVPDVKWRGESENPINGFCVFIDTIYGIRAMERALLVMYHEEGLDTITKLISRWAPPSQNDTEAYIAAVSKAIGLHPLLHLQFPDELIALVKAIIRHENGCQPYPDILFQDAWYLLKQEHQAYDEQ